MNQTEPAAQAELLAARPVELLEAMPGKVMALLSICSQQPKAPGLNQLWANQAGWDQLVQVWHNIPNT